MAKKAPKTSTRYEVITQQDDNPDDMLIPIPPPLLQQMGWKEGDEIEFSMDELGRLVLRLKR
jgi:hypothetical protein